VPARASVPRVDDVELTRRSVEGFAETVAALGRAGAGAVIRRPDAVGARVPSAADNAWIDAVVVPAGARPPERDDPALPHALWTLADEPVAGRVGEPSIAMPCLGLVLDPGVDLGGGLPVQRPTLAEAGEVNDRAYGQDAVLRPLLGALRDDRVEAHGVRAGDAEGWACVALTLRVGDDVSVQYVATDHDHRRRGLASGLLRSVLDAARAGGARTATLQASPDGLPVYERLGFRRTATLHAHLRAGV
jgi:GNAT superfamily N-acetyltransferase